MEKNKGMPFIFVVLYVVFPIVQGFAISSRELTEADAMVTITKNVTMLVIVLEYLKQYNYIDNKVSKAAIVPPGTVAKAVRKFQEMANLPVTGELNAETLNKMAQPRCGVQDVRQGGPAKFVALTPWPKNELSWKITEYSKTSKLTQPEQRDAMARAFKIWARRAKLRFRYVSNPRNPADMDIKFVTGDHGDHDPFDGPYGKLAHAFFPTGGKIHFDDQETWLLGSKAKNKNKGIELYIVAAHEFGHALGLHHSSVRGALMAPFYDYSPSLTLHRDDVRGIQKLYGKKTKEKLVVRL